MARYLVQWTIDIEDVEEEGEAGAQQAALRAWHHMRRPESIACVFDVFNVDTDTHYEVDLVDEYPDGVPEEKEDK